MNAQLKELAMSYIESRRRALNNPSMAEMANLNADNCVKRARALGYSNEEWMQAVKAVYEERNAKADSIGKK